MPSYCRTPFHFSIGKAPAARMTATCTRLNKPRNTTEPRSCSRDRTSAAAMKKQGTNDSTQCRPISFTAESAANSASGSAHAMTKKRDVASRHTPAAQRRPRASCTSATGESTYSSVTPYRSGVFHDRAASPCRL
jgi:hypothetical protein